MAADEKRVRMLVDSFERDDEARKVCIDHHSNSCAVCGFRYDNMFNEEYLQVHYVGPLSAIHERPYLDPISDLRPICAYCHEVIHTYDPLPSIEELKALITIKAS